MEKKELLHLGQIGSKALIGLFLSRTKFTRKRKKIRKKKSLVFRNRLDLLFFLLLIVLLLFLCCLKQLLCKCNFSRINDRLKIKKALYPQRGGVEAPIAQVIKVVASKNLGERACLNHLWIRVRGLLPPSPLPPKHLFFAKHIRVLRTGGKMAEWLLRQFRKLVPFGIVGSIPTLSVKIR